MYFDGSNTTNRILDVLEDKRPKIICIDELDKLARQFQEKLLNFIESGHIKVDQMRKQYDFTIKGAKVFGACNEVSRLSRPLQSRFRCLHLSRYSEEQLLEVSAKVVPKFKIVRVGNNTYLIANLNNPRTGGIPGGEHYAGSPGSVINYATQHNYFARGRTNNSGKDATISGILYADGDTPYNPGSNVFTNDSQLRHGFADPGYYYDGYS